MYQSSLLLPVRRLRPVIVALYVPRQSCSRDDNTSTMYSFSCMCM
jgi:hypothetical protein